VVLLALALYRSGRQAESVRACTRLRQILRDELGLDPSAEIARLEHQIIVQDPALGFDAAGAGDGSVGIDNSFPSLQPRGVLGYRTNLPRNTTPFVGGEELLAEIAEHLHVGSLVTPPPRWCGQDTGAIEYGLHHLADFYQGVFFVDLAPVATPEQSSAQSHRRCRSWQAASVVAGTIVDWIGDRRALLVTTTANTRGRVGVVVDELIARCSNLQILATSRETLRPRYERPSCSSLGADGTAVELFGERHVRSTGRSRRTGGRRPGADS
jgi:hypothetical protein